MGAQPVTHYISTRQTPDDPEVPEPYSGHHTEARVLALRLSARHPVPFYVAVIDPSLEHPDIAYRAGAELTGDTLAAALAAPYAGRAATAGTASARPLAA
jgi:hypothetical protein